MTRAPFATLALAAAFAVAAPHATAADEAEADPFADDPIFNVDFPGGSLPELVEVLSKNSGTFPNIVIPVQAERATVPALTLREVTVGDVVAVLSELGQLDPVTPFALNRTTDNTWLVVTAHTRTRHEPQEAVFIPVRKHLETHSIQDVITTIGTAWKMLELPGEPTSHLQFHEDTNILVASGTKAMLNVVNGALDALVHEARSVREQQLEVQLTQAQQRLQKSEADMKLQSQISEKRFAVSQLDLQRNVDELREENAVLRAKLRDLESALAAAKAKE